MVIYAIDDEQLALHVLCSAVAQVAPDAELKSFTKTEDLLSEIEEKPCDVAFLDIQMRGITGLELARDIVKTHPHINIVFVSGFRDYMGEAWDLMASGYITKPVTEDKVRQQLLNLRHPVETEKKVKMITFGYFTILVDGKPLEFGRAKSKELLAYLVDCRGSSITRREAADILFESGQYTHKEQSYINMIIKELMQNLSDVGAEGIIECTSKVLAVKPDAFDCDSYDFLDGKPGVSFNDEYMMQYSWAEDSYGKFMKK